jgi:calcium binding protein
LTRLARGVTLEDVRKKPREKPLRTRWRKSRLEGLIHRATVDATGEEEEQMGFHTAIEENVKFPFKVALAGSEAVVVGIDVSDDDEIVAVCLHGRDRERRTVPLLDLALPKPPPPGAEWIEAYRLWVSE